MSTLIVIQLGSGSLQGGFPLITAQLWAHPNALPEQFTGSLPAMPQLLMLSQSWQALYRALCDYSAPPLSSKTTPETTTRSLPHQAAALQPDDGPDDESDDLFEIDEGGLQHVSSYDFESLCHSLSEQFNLWLCSAEFGSIERPLRSHLSLQDQIRIVLVTQNDAIRRLPWQKWHLIQDYPGAELALSLPQYQRQQRQRQQVRSGTRTRPRILAILGNAQGIDLTQEEQCLQQIPNADIVFLAQPSRQQFDQALWDAAGWDLLFFAGHSSSDSSEIGRLYINDQINEQTDNEQIGSEQKSKNSLTIDDISEALLAALENGLQLAIFNSCDGLGLANQLAHLNIPQVIVLREPVPNRVAQQFFQSFLSAYVQQGRPLYEAVKRSRRQLQAIEDEFPGASWLPVLCQNPAEEPLSWKALCRSTSGQEGSATSEASVDQAALGMSRKDYRDRQIFLNKVRNSWVKGVLQRSLFHQIMITVGLAEYPLALSNPATSAIEKISPSGYPLPLGTKVTDYFEQLGIGRSLLLLGTPGAGKTTALLDIAQSLIQRAEAEATEPMPVVLSLSAWHPSKKNTAKPPDAMEPSAMSQWLQQSLFSYYQVPQQQSEQWLRSGQLTLLLDGLDEVNSRDRANCIQAINQFRQDYTQVEMVICTRQKAYEAACKETEQSLNVQAALTLQPLSTEQIDDYCIALGEAGQPLQQMIEADDQLKAMMASPLILNILTLAAEEDADSSMAKSFIASASAMSPKARRHCLLEAYVRRMLIRRQPHSVGNSASETSAATISGLRYLAQQLSRTGQSVFQIETIQPDWLSDHDRQYRYPLMLGLVLASLMSIVPTAVGLWLGGIWVGLSIFFSWAVVGGLLSGFIGGWIGGVTGGLIGGGLSTVLIGVFVPYFSVGLIATPIFAIFMGFIFGACHHRIEPIEGFHWSWQKAGKWLVIGLVTGTVISLPMWQAGIVEWRVVIATVAGIFLLLGGFTKRSRLSGEKSRPNEGMWRTGRNALHLGLMATVIYGLLSTVVFALNTGGSQESFQESCLFGLIAGLLMGTLTGLVGAEGSGVVCVQHLVLRVMLWQQKRLPWNYAQFLDSCADRILLKKAGGGYIFIHRLLQEHFANWRPSP